MATVASQIDGVRGMPAAPHEADWQAAMADAVRDPAELCRLLRLDPAVACPQSLGRPGRGGASGDATAQRAAGRFPLLVPRPYLERIPPGDPNDPLLLQVHPRPEELAAAPGFQTDPLGEADAMVGPGLLSKYRGRSLIVTTGACAVHCRFCFRRHFPYSDALGSSADWEPTFWPIEADRSIHEVILSGGDPLTLPDERLAQITRRLADIPHLRRVRLHTRMPVMIPQRVTQELLSLLRGTRLSPIMVVHVNHPAEIDPAVADALGRLVDAGIPVLNQAVLLHAVNDRLEVLAQLCERLVDLRVMPYYVHQLDRVAGTAHFEVPEATGVRLIAQLRARLPGYAVPRYVRQPPGTSGKQVLA